MDLIASRQTGMSAGPIWWSTIQDYVKHKELDQEQQEAMHSHIKSMDLYYLKQLAKK